MIKISIDGSKIAPYDILYGVLKGMLLLTGFALFCVIILGTIFLVCKLVKKLCILIFKKKDVDELSWWNGSWKRMSERDPRKIVDQILLAMPKVIYGTIIALFILTVILVLIDNWKGWWNIGTLLAVVGVVILLFLMMYQDRMYLSTIKFLLGAAVLLMLAAWIESLLF